MRDCGVIVCDVIIARACAPSTPGGKHVASDRDSFANTTGRVTTCGWEGGEAIQAAFYIRENPHKTALCVRENCFWVILDNPRVFTGQVRSSCGHFLRSYRPIFPLHFLQLINHTLKRTNSPEFYIWCYNNDNDVDWEQILILRTQQMNCNKNDPTVFMCCRLIRGWCDLQVWLGNYGIVKILFLYE